MNQHPALLAEDLFPDAVLVRANYFQFQKGEIMAHLQVSSRFFALCKEGEGRVEANGESFQLHAGDFLILPWHHRIKYEADEGNPFLLACVHIIPSHSREHPLVCEVAHDPSEPLTGRTYRADVKFPPLDNTVTCSIQDNLPLLYLSEYIIQLWLREHPDYAHSNQLAILLLAEWQRAASSVSRHTAAVPFLLRRALEFIEDHFHRPISVEDLGKFSDVSPATLNRHFRHYLHTTPSQWVDQRKLKHATMQLSTTSLPIGVIAGQIGFDDQLYFSKWFKKKTGLNPSAFRQKKALW